MPYFGWPAGFIKTKVRYLTIQFEDPDSKVSGVTSFKLDNKDVLEAVLDALAETGALALARERAIEYAEAARASLAGFNHSPYAQALSAIPTYIIERDH